MLPENWLLELRCLSKGLALHEKPLCTCKGHPGQGIRQGHFHVLEDLCAMQALHCRLCQRLLVMRLKLAACFGLSQGGQSSWKLSTRGLMCWRLQKCRVLYLAAIVILSRKPRQSLHLGQPLASILPGITWKTSARISALIDLVILLLRASNPTLSICL